MRGRGVLCSGAIIQDTLVHPVDDSAWSTTSFVKTIEPHTGGNGANTSLALAALGVPVRLLGAVGRDEPGRLVLDTLRRSAVDTRAVETADAPTAATIVLIKRSGDRKFLHRLGASAGAFAAPIEFTRELVDGMAHYHLASLFILPRMRAHAAETLARARAAGLTTSLDTNWDPEGRWMQDLAPCLEHLDLIFMNEDEARMATESVETADAARSLMARGVGAAVMKLGGRGCAIYGAGGEAIRMPAFEVEVVDTTGAGDCFVGGFLAARLRGATYEQAGRLANAVGALSVQRVGGSGGIPGYDEIQGWMRTARVSQ